MSDTDLASLRKDALERAFFDIEQRLQLRVRLKRATTDVVEARQRGAYVLTHVEPFQVGLLVRSLVRSGVPVEHVFELVNEIVLELEDRGYHATIIESVDLINTVDSVLRQYRHEDAHEWAHEYHNRYGWGYEFTTSIQEVDANDLIRTADLDALAEVVQATIAKMGELPALQAAGDADAAVQAMLDRDLQRLIRLTSRAVRATGLHTVSRSLVADTAREIGNWAFSSPPWTTQQREHAMEEGGRLLVEAQRLIAVEDGREAERAIDEALRISAAVLAQRFNLWIGIFDSSAAAVLGRLADRLQVAERIRDASDKSMPQHQFYGGAILKKLADVGLEGRDLRGLIRRITDLARTAAASPDPAAARQQTLEYAITFKNWVTRLIDETETPPSLDSEYFSGRKELAERQSTLNRIVGYVLNAARLDVSDEHANNLRIKIPSTCPVLSQYGHAEHLCVICVAAGRDEGAVSLRKLQTRMRVAPSGPKVIVAPNGITEDAKRWLDAQEAIDEGVAIVVDAEALRGFISLPTEFMRLTELAARELLVTRASLPPSLPAATSDAFARAKRLAASFYHQEALHVLAVECERFVSTTVRGWLVATHGNGIAKAIRDLVGGRSTRLDLGTSVAILKSAKARTQRRLWLESMGVRDAEDVSELPSESVALLNTLKEVRNRSAHGATRAYVEDYLQFRDALLSLLRQVSHLAYWPRLIDIEDSLWSHTAVRERISLLSQSMSGADIVAAFVFAVGRKNDMTLLHVAPAAISCQDCKVVVRIEDWRGTCERPCGEANQTTLSHATVREVPSVKRTEEPAAQQRISPLVDRVVLAQLLDALEGSYPTHEEFDDFCDDVLRLNAEDFRGDRIRTRWKKLLKYSAARGRESAVLKALSEQRPHQSVFSDVAVRVVHTSLTDKGVQSAWAHEVERGIVLPSRGRRVGLFIGLNHYSNSNSSPYGNLAGCTNDAQDLYDTFRRFGAFTDESILLVDDAVGVRAATDSNGWKALILTYLREMLASLRDQDLISFFFAGHGEHQIDDGTGRKRSALVLPSTMAEARQAGFEFLFVDEINELFRGSRVGSSLRVYDCCHSGQDELRTHLSQPVAHWVDEFVFRLGDGHYALAACDFDQVARERGGRGILSKAFGESLRGHDIATSVPTAIDALTAISVTCRMVIEQTNRQQIPRHESGGRGELILTAVRRDA